MSARKESRHFVGFDLGHADTALAYLPESAGAADQPVDVEVQNEKVQPTALLRVKDGEGRERVVIGEAAIQEAGDGAHDDDHELIAAFKARPDRLGARLADLQVYFTACLERANLGFPDGAAGDKEWRDTEIIVGSPSAWALATDVAQYKAILAAGKPDAVIDIVPESRGALLELVLKRDSVVAVKRQKENILIIDIGSSTLDFSLVSPFEKMTPLLDAGLDLGASFFDGHVLDASLEAFPGARAFLDRNPHHKGLWQYAARRAKEKFFNRDPQQMDKVVQSGIAGSYWDGTAPQLFMARVSRAEMDSIRRKPVTSPLGPSAALALSEASLQGLSWEEIYEKSLRAMAKAISDRGETYGSVLLVGGASRMGFTRDIALQVFDPDGADDIVRTDPEPSHMVARGLARWGKRRRDILAFRSEAGEVLQRDLPGVMHEAFPALRTALIDDLVETIFNQFVTPAIDAWKRGEFANGEEVRAFIEKAYEEWTVSAEADLFYTTRINAWWRDEVKHRVNGLIGPLQSKYNVPSDAQLHVDNAIDPAVFSFRARAIALPFETVIELILFTLALVIAPFVDFGLTLGVFPVTTLGVIGGWIFARRWLKQWIAKVETPKIANRLAGFAPSIGVLDNVMRGAIKRELTKALNGAEASILEQVTTAIAVTVERQTQQIEALLFGGVGGFGPAPAIALSDLQKETTSAD